MGFTGIAICFPPGKVWTPRHYQGFRPDSKLLFPQCQIDLMHYDLGDGVRITREEMVDGRWWTLSDNLSYLNICEPHGIRWHYRLTSQTVWADCLGEPMEFRLGLWPD